jgi:predicted transcriptional regulator
LKSNNRIPIVTEVNINKQIQLNIMTEKCKEMGTVSTGKNSNQYPKGQKRAPKVKRSSNWYPRGC